MRLARAWMSQEAVHIFTLGGGQRAHPRVHLRLRLVVRPRGLARLSLHRRECLRFTTQGGNISRRREAKMVKDILLDGCALEQLAV